LLRFNFNAFRPISFDFSYKIDFCDVIRREKFDIFLPIYDPFIYGLFSLQKAENPLNILLDFQFKLLYVHLDIISSAS